MAFLRISVRRVPPSGGVEIYYERAHDDGDTPENKQGGDRSREPPQQHFLTGCQHHRRVSPERPPSVCPGEPAPAFGGSHPAENPSGRDDEHTDPNDRPAFGGDTVPDGGLDYFERAHQRDGTQGGGLLSNGFLTSTSSAVEVRRRPVDLRVS